MELDIWTMVTYFFSAFNMDSSKFSIVYQVPLSASGCVSIGGVVDHVETNAVIVFCNGKIMGSVIIMRVNLKFLKFSILNTFQNSKNSYVVDSIIQQIPKLY